MLALEDYTEWDTASFDFESYADESLFSTGSRFHLFFGQASPEEAATSSAAKYVYKILVTFSGTPVLSSEESNLDLVVGSDHALHVTADAEDDALTAYVQEHLQYASSDPAVVSVDQYGRLHVKRGGRRGHHRVLSVSRASACRSTSAPAARAARAAPRARGRPRRLGRNTDKPKLDLQPDETGFARAQVTEPVGAGDGQPVTRGRRGLDRGKQHDRGRGMQDGSVQLLLPDRQERTRPSHRERWRAARLSLT